MPGYWIVKVGAIRDHAARAGCRRRRCSSRRTVENRVDGLLVVEIHAVVHGLAVPLELGRLHGDAPGLERLGQQTGNDFAEGAPGLPCPEGLSIP